SVAGAAHRDGDDRLSGRGPRHPSAQTPRRCTAPNPGVVRGARQAEPEALAADSPSLTLPAPEAHRASWTRLLLASHLLEPQHAVFVGRHHVEEFIAVDVGDDELRTDAGIVVDLVRHEANQAVAAFLGLEPVELRGGVRVGIAFGSVRPPALAGH